MKVPVDEYPAGPEMDAACAEAMGWEPEYSHRGPFNGWYRPGHRWISWEDWEPSTRIECAWELVESIRSEVRADSDSWDEFVTDLNIQHNYKVSSLLRELSVIDICRAFLKAKGITEIEVAG